ncbi:MAG: LysR family transcriptional regulator [Armatimonadetes bacterium]|nr:LysR family transcriptional regulator [Armatimonadota bacterium]
MNQLELHQLRCLVMLAEELNFGRAATRLHMSQPPLTRIVAEAERIVGVRLFERTTRRVSLTPVGEVLITEARTLLTRLDSAADTVRTAIRQQAGQLRLVYTPLALQTVVPQIVSQLRQSEHVVAVDLVEMTGDAQKEQLCRGDGVMGFCDEPLTGDGLESVLLHREPLRILVTENHPHANNDTFAFAGLARETIILHERDEYPRYYDRVIGACKASGLAPQIHHRAPRQNCLALVTAGVGVLLIPANFLFSNIAGLRVLPISDAPESLCAEVWAVFPPDNRSPFGKILRRIVRAIAL